MGGWWTMKGKSVVGKKTQAALRRKLDSGSRGKSEAGVIASWTTTQRAVFRASVHRRIRNNIRASNLDQGEKELDCCSVIQSSKLSSNQSEFFHFIWKSRLQITQNPSGLKSSVKFPQSVMIRVPSHHVNILKHLMLLSADRLYGEESFLPPVSQLSLAGLLIMISL